MPNDPPVSQSAQSPEGARWTIFGSAGGGVVPGGIQPHYNAAGMVEVMPVSEHEADIKRLRHAIQDHRMSIRAAGPVRVDSRDVPVADEKQRADERLWSVLDA